jgi:hypothetical protein
VSVVGCWLLIVGIGCRSHFFCCQCPALFLSALTNLGRGGGGGLGRGRGDHLLFKNLVSEMPKCHVLDKQKNRLKPGLISSEVKLNVLHLNLQTEKEKFKPYTEWDGTGMDFHNVRTHFRRKVLKEVGFGKCWILKKALRLEKGGVGFSGKVVGF